MPSEPFAGKDGQGVGVGLVVVAHAGVWHEAATHTITRHPGPLAEVRPRGRVRSRPEATARPRRQGGSCNASSLHRDSDSDGWAEGRVQSSDDVLDLQLAFPKELGGPGGAATNPEQLFAAGYAACFENALMRVARERKAPIRKSSVTAHVGIRREESGYFRLAVDLEVSYHLRLISSGWLAWATNGSLSRG